MDKYSVTMQRTASTTLSVGSITTGATAHRWGIYDIVVGSEASPADNVFLWQVQRCTTAGTSTAVTPQPLDSADSAALEAAGQNHTVDPTLTANAIVLNIPLNQRASFRWAASPDGWLIAPATASNGFAVRTPTASAVVVTATVMFNE